jgi:hypothetical protein
LKTIVCVASGPSLTPEDVNYCRGKAEVIVVNDNWRLAPWADYLYATDYQWWKHYLPEVREKFSGKLLTVDEAAHDRLGVPWVRGKDEPGLSKRRDILHTGDNSGYAAINFAYHLGAERIVLLGYDMQGTHWFGDHPPEFCTLNDFPDYLSNFPKLAEDLLCEGVRVINATRSTALECFPRMTIEEALA